MYWSTTQIGDSVLFSPAAHVGICALSCWILVMYEPMPVGMICATCVYMLSSQPHNKLPD